MSVARVGVRLLLLAGAAATTTLLARSALERKVDRRVDDAIGALAALTRALPAPHDVDTSPALPPMPASLASAIASTIASSAADPPTPPPPPGPTAGPKRPTPRPAAERGPGAVAVSRAEVDAAIASRCGGVRATPARDDDGVPIGFALRNVGALARFGVQEGDVLVAAAGHALRTPDEAFAALGALKDAQRVTFVLRRGGATYGVTLALEK
ncbi:MAG: hypothetical protein NVS3B10_26670 [Polyangiales bacterium]